jgi:hypothetical protein
MAKGKKARNGTARRRVEGATGGLGGNGLHFLYDRLTASIRRPGRRGRPSAARRPFAAPPAGRVGLSRHRRVLVAAAVGALALTIAAGRAPRPLTASSSASIAAIETPGGSWTDWTVVTDATSLSPALAAGATADAMDLASVDSDGAVSHARWDGFGWSDPVATGQSTALPPLLLVDAAGTPNLIAVSNGGQVSRSFFQNEVWGAPSPTGATTALPPAAVINRTDGTLELITVGADKGVRHSRFLNGAWSSAVPLKQSTSLPPALIANPAGGLDLAVVGTDGQVVYSHFAGTQWGGFQATGVKSALAPALAVGDDGVVNLVVTAPDQSVVHSRRVNTAWTRAFATGLQSSLSPTVVFSPAGKSLEMLAVDLDGTVQHARYTKGAWAAPVPLDLTTEARPALTATATGVAAAVVDTDGQVQTSQFVPAVEVSFKTDVLRIFTNNGGKTCAQSGCHSGSRPAAGMGLEATKAYKSIVNVRDRVVPGDPDGSLLYQYVESGRMPQRGGSLADADIERIRLWILQGALNN